MLHKELFYFDMLMVDMIIIMNYIIFIIQLKSIVIN